MSQTISVIPGDGIGPEIMAASLRVLDELSCGLEYEFVEAGLVGGLGLAQLGMLERAERLRGAIRSAIAAADRPTPDLGGSGTTERFADAIIERIGRLSDAWTSTGVVCGRAGRCAR